MPPAHLCYASCDLLPEPGSDMAENNSEIISVIELFEFKDEDFLFEMIGKYNP
jgi:hypothetical protein